MSDLCTYCTNNKYNTQCCNKRCKNCCNNCNHYNRKLNTNIIDCSQCTVNTNLHKCCNNFCYYCCKSLCINNKYEEHKISQLSSFSDIQTNDILLKKYLVEVKNILSYKLNDNILDLVVKFIDNRKKCIVCKIFFEEDDIYYEKCQDCNEYCCEDCIGNIRFLKCIVKNCYYCKNEWYNNNIYYYCKLCDNSHSLEKKYFNDSDYYTSDDSD